MHLLMGIKIKAVSIGLIIFITLYALNHLIDTALVRGNINPAPFSVIYGYVSFFICGYFTGFVSKEYGFLNGALLGILTPLVSIIYMVWSQYGIINILANLFEHGLFWLFIGVVCCGLGGLIWDLQSKIIKAISNKLIERRRY